MKLSKMKDLDLELLEIQVDAEMRKRQALDRADFIKRVEARKKKE